MRWLILALLALPALSQDCEVEELRFSLLQSSLQVAKAPRDGTELQLRQLVHQAKEALHRRLSLAYALVMPEKSAVSGIPALLVFMLAGLVMALFVVQLIGVFFERPEKGGAMTTAPPRGSMGYSTGGTLPPMSLPPSRNSYRSNGTASAPSTVGAVPGREGAMCPALIVPYAEAHFSIPQQGLRTLAEGLESEVPPVAVLGGQTGKALLYARFKVVKDRRWLELSTTAHSRFPHCSAGPLDAPMVEIRGPRGDRYGKLEKQDSTWRLVRSEGQVVKTVAVSHGSLTAMDGPSLVATGRVSRASLEVQVSPGRDSILALLSMLAIMLNAPEELGL